MGQAPVGNGAAIVVVWSVVRVVNARSTVVVRKLVNIVCGLEWVWREAHA